MEHVSCIAAKKGLPHKLLQTHTHTHAHTHTLDNVSCAFPNRLLSPPCRHCLHWQRYTKKQKQKKEQIFPFLHCALETVMEAGLEGG